MGLIEVIKGSGHISIWLYKLLITIDHWGWKHKKSPLIDFSWNPD